MGGKENVKLGGVKVDRQVGAEQEEVDGTSWCWTGGGLHHGLGGCWSGNVRTQTACGRRRDGCCWYRRCRACQF